MLAFSSRRNKNQDGFEQHAGGSNQPLPYLDPTYSSPNANAGRDLLEQNGLILRPRIGGGSSNQPLAYLDPTYSPNAGPSHTANVGTDLLKQNGLIVRPAIERQTGGNHGGFLPSVMKGVVNSGVIVAPLAAMAVKRMMYNTRKGKHGGGKKENWSHNREIAKEELLKYGKPSATNVNKFAALKRKNLEAAEDWLTEYIVKKRKTKTKGKGKGKGKGKTVKGNTNTKTKTNTKTASLWKNLLDRAKHNLEPYGKPSGANTAKLASLHKKGMNTAVFLSNYQTRKKYAPPKTLRNKYQNNLQQARQYLSHFGKPTVANISKFVSLKRKNMPTNDIETAVKSRVGKSVVKTVKSTAKSPPPANVKKYLQLLQKKIKKLEKDIAV